MPEGGEAPSSGTSIPRAARGGLGLRVGRVDTRATGSADRPTRAPWGYAARTGARGRLRRGGGGARVAAAAKSVARGRVGRVVVGSVFRLGPGRGRLSAAGRGG